MRLAFLAAAATTAAFFLFAGPASAQSESEPACNAGDAEACFYTGAEYAQGLGVPEDKQKAATFFLKSCDGGIPDGCTTTGYFYVNGDGNVPKDVIKGVEYMERACGMGHVDGCDKSLGHRLSTTSPAHDFDKAVATAKAACEAGVENPCFWGLYWGWDGNEGKYPAMINMANAGWFAERTCDKYHDEMACSVAARVYAAKRDDHEARRRLMRILAQATDPTLLREAADALVNLYLLRGENKPAIATLSELRLRTDDGELHRWIDARLKGIVGD